MFYLIRLSQKVGEAMQFKDRIVYTSKPDIVADTERSGFGDPIPVLSTETGYWCYAWPMEQ
jgi:hypothetical protein